MDFKEVNNDKVLFCPNCMTKRDENDNFCKNCGTHFAKNIISDEEFQQVISSNFGTTQNSSNNINKNTDNNSDNTDDNSGYIIPLAIIAAIISIVLSFLIPYIYILFIALGFLSLTRKGYRAYGIALFVGCGALMIIGIIFIIIMFGACFASFS